MKVPEEESNLIFTHDEQLTEKQKNFLRIYDAVLCNVSLACQQCNIARTTYYYWLKESPAFKENAENIKEGLIDFAESKLMQEVRSGNTAAILFFLKTQGKSRGYVERVEQDVTVNKFEELMQSLPDEDEEKIKNHGRSKSKSEG